MADELERILAETRQEAILQTLEAWRKDVSKPREGVQALEQMAQGLGKGFTEEVGFETMNIIDFRDDLR